MDHTATWVSQARQAGWSDLRITETLRAKGWSATDVRAALSGQPPAPAIPAAPVRSRRLLPAFLIVATLMILGGGAAFAHYQGYITLPFLGSPSREPETLLQRSLANLAKASSGEIGMAFSLAAEPRDPSLQPTSADPGPSIATLRSQDAFTSSHVAQLRTALVLYADDHANDYPAALDALAPNYISTIPNAGDETPFSYSVTADKKSYSLVYWCRAADPDQQLTMTADTFTSCSKVASGTASLSRGLEQYLFEMPSDMRLDVAFTSFSDFNQAATDRRGTVSLNGSYQSGGTTYAADIEARLIGDQAYLHLRRLPQIIFFDFSPLQDKWITVDMAGQGTADEAFNIGELINLNDSSKTAALLRTELPHLTKLAFDHDVITVSDQGTEDLNGEPAVRLAIALHPEALPAWVAAYRHSADERSVDISSLNEMLAPLEQAETVTQLRNATQNTTLTAWVDRAHEQLRKIELAIVMVPPDQEETPADHQYRLRLGMTFARLGEQPAVTAPENPITFEEATALMNGPSDSLFNTDWPDEAPTEPLTQDSDGDGLTDSMEPYYGTDPSKRDTDEDGYDDKTEIYGGYDPLTPATSN